jgi:hypothetical protein
MGEPAVAVEAAADVADGEAKGTGPGREGAAAERDASAGAEEAAVDAQAKEAAAEPATRISALAHGHKAYLSKEDNDYKEINENWLHFVRRFTAIRLQKWWKDCIARKSTAAAAAVALEHSTEEVAGGDAAEGGEVEVVRSHSTKEEEEVLP